MEDPEIILQCEGFVYRKPTAEQLELINKKYPFLLQKQEIIYLSVMTQELNLEINKNREDYE